MILIVIAIAQLMVILDGTVMNIALPSAQHALHFSNVDRQWVLTGYSLSFGSLLLFGGRLADLVGRRRMFITGLAGFAIASAVGGASVNFAMLVTDIRRRPTRSASRPRCRCSRPPSPTRRNAARRSASTARWRRAAARSGCCSAAR
jgi:hypothetical protein